MATKKTTKTAPKTRTKKAVAKTDAAPTGKKTKTPKATGATTPDARPPKKLSALDAAAKVLGKTGQAMTCQELIAEMATRQYWTSPNGATPHATLYAAILRVEVADGLALRRRDLHLGPDAGARFPSCQPKHQQFVTPL